MMPEGWVSETLSTDGVEAFFRASVERQADAEENTRTNRRHDAIFCIGAVAIGVLGMAAGLTAYIKTPIPAEPPWVLVHDLTGVIDHPVAARDAPRLFGESVRRRAMQNFIVACEQYLPQTWAKIDFHACMVMASPDEQKRREADIGKGGPHYPPTVFGPTGWAKPTAFPAFVPQGTVGSDPNQVYRYQVRYERTEVASGRESRVRYTADLAFTFRPELKISDADRLLNESGFQAISFSTVKDSLQ